MTDDDKNNNDKCNNTSNNENTNVDGDNEDDDSNDDGDNDDDDSNDDGDNDDDDKDAAVEDFPRSEKSGNFRLRTIFQSFEKTTSLGVTQPTEKLIIRYAAAARTHEMSGANI